ncbi:MAG: phage Antsirabe [Actinomycetota bacterium]
MTGWPVPEQYAITTAYGKRGPYWSCSENSSGGVHTGADFACPDGTPVYATIAGDVRHRNYGSAFGSHQVAISPDPGEPFGDGEVFYAHMRSRVADGTRVEVGDQIGEVDSEGNVSGAHLHYEYHPHSKGSWSCSVHADPAPTLSRDGQPAEGGPYVTEHVYRSKCGYGEPTNGDEDSDTVMELQERLNRVTLKGGQELEITGRYDEDTDEEVRLWQEQVCGDIPDQPRQSFLGPEQFKKMFSESVYTLHDDGDAAIASDPGENPNPEPEPPVIPSEMGQRFIDATALVTAPVWFEDDWDNDEIAGNGIWFPVDGYMLLHHTAGTDSLDWILYGGDYQPTRLANFLVDRDGTLHVCAARKTYHAGKGSWHGIPDDCMNDYSVGVEIESLGTSEDLTEAQILTVSQLASGWMLEFGMPIENIINHRDWSSTGKTDTLYDQEWWWEQIESLENPPTPPEEPDEPEPGYTIRQFGKHEWYSGKETDDFVLHPDGDWHKVCDEMAPSGITAPSSEFHFLYLRVGLPDGRSSSRNIEAKWTRSDGDETAYHSPEWTSDSKDSIAFYDNHFESGSGLGGQWWVKVTGGTDPVVITTRYGKTHVLYQDAIEIASMALTGLGRRLGGPLGWLLLQAGDWTRPEYLEGAA